MSLSKITAEFAESAAVTITQLHEHANVLCYKTSPIPVATCEYSTNVVVVSQIEKLIYLDSMNQIIGPPRLYKPTTCFDLIVLYVLGCLLYSA